MEYIFVDPNNRTIHQYVCVYCMVPLIWHPCVILSNMPMELNHKSKQFFINQFIKYEFMFSIIFIFDIEKISACLFTEQVQFMSYSKFLNHTFLQLPYLHVISQHFLYSRSWFSIPEPCSVSCSWTKHLISCWICLLCCTQVTLW